jgi:hypothetical protein
MIKGEAEEFESVTGEALDVSNPVMLINVEEHIRDAIHYSYQYAAKNLEIEFSGNHLLVDLTVGPPNEFSEAFPTVQPETHELPYHLIHFKMSDLVNDLIHQIGEDECDIDDVNETIEGLRAAANAIETARDAKKNWIE